jgi:hypothetical protein
VPAVAPAKTCAELDVVLLELDVLFDDEHAASNAVDNAAVASNATIFVFFKRKSPYCLFALFCQRLQSQFITFLKTCQHFTKTFTKKSEASKSNGSFLLV